MINCPNCGAPIDGHKCQYCGTVIFDFAAIEVGKPIWISLKTESSDIYMAHVIPEIMEFKLCPSQNILYADNMAYTVISAYEPPRLRLQFVEIPNNDGVCHYISERAACSVTEIGEVKE